MKKDNDKKTKKEIEKASNAKSQSVTNNKENEIAEKKRADKREAKTDFAIGLCTVLAVFAVLTAIIVFAGKTSGVIAYAGEVRRGNEQVFTYKSPKLKKGDTVTWYVNDEKVATSIYDGEASLTYTPEKEGSATLKVVAGKYSQSKVINIKKPLVTLRAVDTEMTYGEQMPQLSYTCEGLIDENDCASCEVRCDADGTQCGEYEICIDNAECDGYEVRCENAVLSVKPREVKIAELQKVYDQNDKIEIENPILEGVLDTDEIVVNIGEINTGSKNVGEYVVSTENFLLTGENSQNYFLCGEVKCKILSKEITLKGLTVEDKNYDGTTKANICKMGTLSGICEGDSVAVGNLEVAFESALQGVRKVNVKNVNLVGFDKDNYVVTDVEVKDAEIK